MLKSSQLYTSLQEKAADTPTGRTMGKKRANQDNKTNISKMAKSSSETSSRSMNLDDIDHGKNKSILLSTQPNYGELRYLKSDSGPFKGIVSFKHSREEMAKPSMDIEVSRSLIKFGI